MFSSSPRRAKQDNVKTKCQSVLPLVMAVYSFPDRHWAPGPHITRSVFLLPFVLPIATARVNRCAPLIPRKTMLFRGVNIDRKGGSLALVPKDDFSRLTAPIYPKGGL
jgi:hypothetical protein